MYSQYLNEQFQLQSQEEIYDKNPKQKTETIPYKQTKSQPQKSNKIDLPKISTITITPNAQTLTITANKEKKAISQLQKSNSRYLPKQEMSHKSGSLNKRDTQYLKRDNQLAQSTKLPFKEKVGRKDKAELFGHIEVGQFIEGKERNINYKSLSTHFMNKNKKNALKITSKCEEQKFSQQFYHSKQELQQLTIEQITVLSKRLKEKIKALDNTLSQKVEKALQQFKQGTAQPQPPEKQYSLLKFKIQNNESLLQNLSFDYLKLQSKEGQLEEEYYELQLEKEVTITMQKIRQAKRDILQMKKRARTTSSFQLNGSDIQSKMAKRSNVLKLDLFKIRQQVDKNEAKMEQFQAKNGQIQDKSYRLSQKQSSLIEQAKNKKIRLEPDLFLRRSLQLKMKIDKCKQLRNNSENHIQRATNTLTNQINHMNNQIRQYEEDRKGVETKINEIQKKAFTFIENNHSLLKNIVVSPLNSINYFQRKLVLQEQEGKFIKPIVGIKALKQQQKREKNQLKQISQSTQQQNTQKAEKLQTPQSREENEFMNLTESKIKQLTPIPKDQNLRSPPSSDSIQQNQAQTALPKVNMPAILKNYQNQFNSTHQSTIPKRFRLKRQKPTIGLSEQQIGNQ